MEKISGIALVLNTCGRAAERRWAYCEPLLYGIYYYYQFLAHFKVYIADH